MLASSKTAGFWLWKTTRDLIKEGLRFSDLADPKMKDKNGNVTNLIAFEFHTRVDTELRNFGDSNV